MSASEKAQLEMNKQQFGEEMAWKYWETQYMSRMSLAQAQAEAGPVWGGLDGYGTQGPATTGAIAFPKMYP